MSALQIDASIMFLFLKKHKLDFKGHLEIILKAISNPDLDYRFQS